MVNGGDVVVVVPVVVTVGVAVVDDDLTKVNIRSDSSRSGRNKFCTMVIMADMD